MRRLIDEVSVTAPGRVWAPLKSELERWHREARAAGLDELAGNIFELLAAIRISQRQHEWSSMLDEIVEVPAAISGEGSGGGTSGSLERMTARQAAAATGKSREYICRLAREHVIAGEQDERGTWSLTRSSVEAYMNEKAS